MGLLKVFVQNWSSLSGSYIATELKVYAATRPPGLPQEQADYGHDWDAPLTDWVTISGELPTLTLADTVPVAAEYQGFKNISVPDGTLDFLFLITKHAAYDNLVVSEEHWVEIETYEQASTWHDAYLEQPNDFRRMGQGVGYRQGMFGAHNPVYGPTKQVADDTTGQIDNSWLYDNQFQSCYYFRDGQGYGASQVWMLFSTWPQTGGGASLGWRS